MSLTNLSDKNVLARRAALVSKVHPYSDLDLTLAINEFQDITPLTDIDAVKQSVRNLVLTNFNERPFRPKLGGNITALLFEPADKFTMISLKESIKFVLEKYEKRVDQVTVQIEDDSDNNRYLVNLGFRVITLDFQTDVTVYLVRVR